MLLAYQLVSNGVAVDVVERHHDFDREFRGELVMPSALDFLSVLGVLPQLVSTGDARLGVERELYVGAGRRVYPPGARQVGAWISQSALLRLLHSACSRHAGYRTHFGLPVTAVDRDDHGNVTALVAGRADDTVRFPGSLFVLCTGRGSAARILGLDAQTYDAHADVLWLRFDFQDLPGLLPSNVQVHMFGRGRVLVQFQTSR